MEGDQVAIQPGLFADTRRVVRCMICNRPLTAAESIERGKGPVCAAHTRREGAMNTDTHEKLLPQPLTEGIVIERDQDGEVLTNVPRRVTHHSPSGFEFGYGGSGPADLALNLAEAALLEIGHEGPRTPCWKGDVFRAAYLIHQDLKWTFIAPLDRRAGGTIPWGEIAGWVERKLAGMDEFWAGVQAELAKDSEEETQAVGE